MSKIIKLSSVLLLLSIFMFSCREDDDVTHENVSFNSENYTFQINENSSNGTSLGYVLATSTLGEIEYSIIAQSANEAIGINGITGELIIADSMKFNFEANSAITAVVRATINGDSDNVNLTINLIDLFNLD